MKPILVKRSIGEGANTMDVKSGRASCYIRLGKIFRSLGKFEIGSLGVISRRKNNGEGGVVVTALESDAGMDSNDRNFIFGVCGGPAQSCRQRSWNSRALSFCRRYRCFERFQMMKVHVCLDIYCYVSLFPKIASLVYIYRIFVQFDSRTQEFPF